MYERTGWAQVLQVPTSLIPPGADLIVYFTIRTALQQLLHQAFSTVRSRNAGDSADHCRSAEKSTEFSDTSESGRSAFTRSVEMVATSGRYAPRSHGLP